jgi:uncharacterized damage-inducible protein DinB
METLRQLARYNAWANERVFALCRSVEPSMLTDMDQGSIGSIAQTLKHLTGVEDGYLAMLRDVGDTREPRDVYFAHDSDWFARLSEELGEGYLALLAERDAPWLDGAMQVPWFDFTMTKRDGLLQVFTHSAQHRAQVFSLLGTRGVKVPDLDYVFMVGEAAHAPSA